MLKSHRFLIITCICLFCFLFLLAATQPAAAQNAAISPTATLTATPTTVLTTTQTPPEAPSNPPANTATVATTGGKRLHVRSGPGANYPIVLRLNQGERYAALSRDGSGQWVQLALPQLPVGSGWVSSHYVTLSNPIGTLPVAANVSSAPIPAPRAPVPTPLAPTPGLASLTGKLAVPVFDANQGVYNVYLVNADGSNWRLVAPAASAPALSHDGARLAYRHWQLDDRGLVVANADGSAPWRLTEKLEDTLPSFSPDDKKIAFSSYREGDRKSRLYYVWSDEQKLRAWEWGDGGDFGVDPYWLADGQIVYRGLWPATELWRMNGDATDQQRIFAGQEPVAIAGAPDSGRIAFMAADNGNWDIYALTMGEATARRLTTDPANDGLPAWSPDGQAIAFVSDRGGRWGLWVMNADGTSQRLLSVLPGAADGRVLFEPDYLNHGWVEEQIAWGR